MNKKVLIIDDDELTLQLYDLMLEDIEGVTFRTMGGGTEALAFLDYCTVADWPNYIFVDLNMPNMTGYEFVEEFQIRHGQKEPASQIYVLTSSVSHRDIETGKKYPLIQGFLSKPLTEDNLNTVLEGAMK